jgi:gamma-glutamyltranspeptidase/glutathione hydrolase
MTGRARSFSLGFLLLLCAGTAAAAPISTRKGLVVAAHPAAARIGAETLARGGNAADALVATAFALAVAEPQSSGLGGGGFALLYEARSRLVSVIDFREVAPAAATPGMFDRNGQYEPLLSREGGRAVAVPGAVAGYAWIAAHHGKLPLASLVAPASELAEKGVTLDAGDVRALQRGADVLKHSPAAADYYGLGRDVSGTLRLQPALGTLLRSIGRDGPATFYRGASAEAVVRAVQRAGGVLTAQDLAKYQVRTLAPLEGTYRGHRIVTVPPPSAGGIIVLQTLAALEKMRFPIGQANTADPTRLHDLAEVWDRAFAARLADIGDPRVEPQVTSLVPQLLAPSTIGRWVKSIGPRATSAEEIGRIGPIGKGISEGPDTTHVCAVDSAGNVALMTTTINGPFGSGVLVPELGIVLNNEMDDFAAPAGGNLYGLVGGRYNAVAPGKTPVSTMAPLIVFDGDRPWIAAGTPGGSTIATTLTQVVLHIVDDGMDVAEAVAAPRVHAQFHPDDVRVEPHAWSPETITALQSAGHRVVTAPFTFGNVQAVVIAPDGVRYGASDPRGSGAAVPEDLTPGVAPAPTLSPAIPQPK